MVHTGHMATPKKSTREKLATQGIRLGGVREVAAALGTNPTNITTWMSRRHQNGCPESIADARMGSIFDINEWITWHEGFSGRRPARRGGIPQGERLDESA